MLSDRADIPFFAARWRGEGKKSMCFIAQQMISPDINVSFPSLVSETQP
jgi:hypothetical protein